ncbi:MAG: hypothetical protein M1275_00080, partial [Patescibacteria group bacterium]|nr:hypothetical protein [Patescibacteria group bacterium]
MLSNTADFANSSWLNYATSYSWTLTEGNGVKIVYAKFKNVGGSSDVTSATINLNVYAAIPVNVTPTIETPATQTPTGQTVAFSGNGHAEGALVLGTDGRTVYRVEGGQLYAFRSAEEFRSYGYDFASVLPASSDDMALTFAGIKSAAIGSLIKAEGHATVWLVGENNQIRPFPSLGMFTRLGYNLSNVISVPDLSGYFGGPVME